MNTDLDKITEVKNRFTNLPGVRERREREVVMG